MSITIVMSDQILNDLKMILNIIYDEMFLKITLGVDKALGSCEIFQDIFIGNNPMEMRLIIGCLCYTAKESS